MASENKDQIYQENETTGSMEVNKTDLKISETPMELNGEYSPLLRQLIRGKSRNININEKQMVANSGDDSTKKDKMAAKIIAIPKCDRKDSSKSFVWDHFTKNPDSGRCECHHCGKLLSSANGNTTSMRKHMTSMHPHEIKASD